jgi:uncharacterized protein (DUF58 family)
MGRELFDPAFLHSLESLALVSRRLLRGEHSGGHRSRRRGSSLEFHDYREYRQGDDFRYIDWNIYRRLGKEVVKLYEAEEELTVHLLIDSSGSMAFGTPSKFAYARRLAAALGYIAASRLDRVRIVPLTDRFHPGYRTSGERGHAAAMFDFLEELKPGGTTAVSAALSAYAAGSMRPGLAVLISDLLSPDGFAEGLAALQYKGFDLLLIHIISPEEVHPELNGEALLIDGETGEEMAVSGGEATKHAYDAALRRHFEESRSFCMERGIEYLRTSIELPVEQALLHYLRKGVHLSR